MARKDGSTLQARQKGAQSLTKAVAGASWASVGIDTSMSSLAVVAVGYDATLDKMVGPTYAERRWYADDDYFKRLGEAAKSHDLVLDALTGLWVIELDRVVIVAEEPWYYGAVKQQQSAWLKQQAEIAGAFKGGLVRYGFPIIYEINNQQWRKVIRDEGVTIRKGQEGKWDIKEWAIKAFGLPEFPDLVKDKGGSKIPRPESGFGAKAKAIQPSDIYDAAACAAWGQNEIVSGKSVLGDV